MKLLNRTIRCGGPKGCGMLFEFLEGETVEDAAAVFQKHRNASDHWREVAEWQNSERMLDGLAPLDPEEYR